MKRTLLLITGGLIVFSANGQYIKNNAGLSHSEKAPFVSAQAHAAPPAHHSGAKTTTTAFVTEDFGTGSPGVLPAGWTAGSFTGGTWKWTNHASTSTYTMGAMASSSASNGWMIFDSDSIGAACSCAPAGWLQSPSYNCATQPFVRLNFQDYYRKFEDSCYVWVSTNPAFTTYSSFPVVTNNELTTNTYSANPENVHINISAAAGGQASVYIRFVTWGPDQGAYSWMIDDMTLSTMDSVDIALRKPSILYFPGGSGSQYSFGTMPAKMMDTVVPVTYVVNYGHTAFPAVSVNAKIFKGAANVYNATVPVNAPVNAYDSLADFSNGSPAYYFSNTIGSYMVPFNVNPAADAVTANNFDTTYYNVTDSALSENTPGSVATSSGYVHRPGSSAYSFSPATQFIVPNGQSDTLTSVSVAFGQASKAGQVVGVQIYHFDGTNWVYDGLTQFRALVSGEISTSSTINYATFMVDEVTIGGKIILAGGTNYAAVVKGSSNTDTVTVLEGDNPAPYAITGYTGLQDTSNNDGSSSQEFGQGHLPYGNDNTPFINLNFGVVQNRTGITNISGNNFIGKAYPNPANTSVAVPFTLMEDGTVTATLSNVMGQVISTQYIDNKAGKPAKAAFVTTSLANGVYLYSIEFNGQHTTGRIVVAH